MTALKVWSTSEHEVTVRLVNLEVTAQLSFGDGSDTVSVNPATGFLRHVYAQPGAYTLTLKGGAEVLATERIFARSGDAPAITWAAGADNPNFIDFTWAETPADLVSTYDVIWGDGAANATVTAPAGHVASHGYAAGDYTVKVYDQQARRWGRYDISVHDKVYDPNLTVEQGTGRYEAVATISAIASPGKEVKVWWGDGTDPDVVANPQVGTQVRHIYDFDDTYMVQVGYADGTGEGGAVFINIPWPAKGTKPASRVEWSPEPEKALGVRAKWHGSGWHYTLHWGDGHQERVRWQDPPTPHIYDRPGTYTVTAVSDLHAEWTTSAQVTVRASAAPQASFTLVEPGGNRVRAMLGAVAEPIQYQIAWGDHVVTEHGAGDLEPIHEYAWNTPAPQIVVRDVPAKRLGRFTGPDIGPAPEPDAPIDGFYLEYVSQNADSRRFRLRGGGVPPGETLTWYPHHLSWYRDVTADEHGRISDEIDIPRGVNADFDYRWFSFGIVGTTVPRQYIPVHPNRAAQGLADLTYQINVDNPYELEFSATPPMLGSHQIDFGDGVQATVDIRSLPMRVKHTYTKTEDITATVTLPDGRTATREVRGYTPAEPCFNYNYPGSCSVVWLFNGWEPEHPCPAGGAYGSEEYSPVIIDNGYHVPHQIHRPDSRNGWHVSFGYGMPVGTHVFKYTSTFRPTSDHPVNIAKAAPFKRLDPPPIELLELEDLNAEITAWFGDVVEWDGGYQGKFHVTNHTGEVVSWQIEFVLDGPAQVREVWPEDITHVESLGSGRWRIWSETQMEESWTVGARIEPPGDPRKWPDGIRGSIRQPPSPELPAVPARCRGGYHRTVGPEVTVPQSPRNLINRTYFT